MSSQALADYFMTQTDLSWTKRFKGKITDDCVSFVGQGQQFHVREIEEDVFEVWYEHALHDVTRERCSFNEAIQLIQELMSRERLCYIPKRTN